MGTCATEPPAPVKESRRGSNGCPELKQQYYKHQVACKPNLFKHDGPVKSDNHGNIFATFSDWKNNASPQELR